MNAFADLHTHTVASGHAYSTLNENIAAAAQRGLKIYGVSDHTPNMPGSTQLFYFRNLHVIPDVVQGVRVLKGAELNIIDAEGGVDLDKSTLKLLDYAIASLHVPCFSPAHSLEENTRALIQAARNPYVQVLGHPDDSRYPIDREAVVRACVETHTLIEINNSSMNPESSRVGGYENILDLLKVCAALGCPVLMGTDAHYSASVGDFSRCRQALEEAAFPAELIVNDSEAQLAEYFGVSF